MEACDRARHGWDAAVTLVTPIERRWQVRRQRSAILRAFDRDWLIRFGNDLGWIPFEPVGDQFKRLNHLHYARWSLVDRLPRTSADQPEETGPYTLLLFTSHFDFGWRRYLGTFIEAVGNGLQHLWADAPSWVAPGDGFSRFERFVDDQRVDHAHLFAAYPNWSCNDVRCALRIHDDCESFDANEGVLRDRFGLETGAEARRRTLLRRLQYCLGDVPPILPEYGAIPAATLPVDPYPTQGVTYLVPLPRAAATEVDEICRGLPYGPDSPFAGVPGTHFARMALIGQGYFDQQPKVNPFRSAYLLLSAEIDGDPEPWLTTLFEDVEMREILARCWGFTRQPDVGSFLSPCRIDTTLEYIDYPMTTVADIFAASADLERHVKELLQ
jgi:hypothetical protein